MKEIVLGGLFASLVLAGCASLVGIKYACDGSIGASGLNYGLGGSCTFVNAGPVQADACATVRLRENNVIVGQQKVCTSVPSNQTARQDFFIGGAVDKQYTWDYS